MKALTITRAIGISVLQPGTSNIAVLLVYHMLDILKLPLKLVSKHDSREPSTDGDYSHCAILGIAKGDIGNSVTSAIGVRGKTRVGWSNSDRHCEMWCISRIADCVEKGFGRLEGEREIWTVIYIKAYYEPQMTYLLIKFSPYQMLTNSSAIE
jgi:hypothetical protein